MLFVKIIKVFSMLELLIQCYNYILHKNKYCTLKQIHKH